MRMRCAVLGCVPVLGEVKKTHLFPKEPARFQVWLKFSGKAKVSQHGFICGKHFRDEDYQESKRILGRPKRFWKLNRDAVPTLRGPDPAKISEAKVHHETVEQPMESGSVEIEVEEEVAATAKCRLCLNVPEPTDAGVCSLFAEMDDQESISDHLRKLFQLEFEEAEGWPSIICDPCVKFIRQLKHFKEMIVSSHCQLHRQIGSANAAKVVLSPDEAKDVPDTDGEPVAEEQSIHTTLAVAPELNKVAKDRGLLKCHLCEVDAADLAARYNHMDVNHPEEQPYIICCEARFPIKANAMPHLRLHVDLRCPECDASFQFPRGLHGHMTSAHKIKKKHVCHICGKVSQGAKSLETHILGHGSKDKRPFKCTYCDSRFITKNCVRRHVARLHEVQKRVVCDICGIPFSCKSTLAEHLRFHAQSDKRGPSDGSKRITVEQQNCFVCGKNMANLEEHMSIKHNRTTELTPEEMDTIKCGRCGMTTRRADMRLHTKTHSNGQYCNICCIRFGSGSQYKKHINRCTPAPAVPH